jgi:hypothetical protein
VIALVLALAMQTQPAPRVDAQGRSVTVISLPDDLIEGTLRQPDAVVVRTPPKHIAKSLIQLRKDFRGEILATGSLL